MIISKGPWTFHGYVSPAGNQLVQEWFDELSEVGRDEFSDIVIYLACLPKSSWGRPPFGSLDDGLSELRAKDNVANKHYRIYGCFWPVGVRFQYTLLHGTEKKVSNDQRGKTEALKRMKQLERGEAGIHEFNFEK